MVKASNLGFDMSGFAEIRPIEPALARFLVVKQALDDSKRIGDEDLVTMCELQLEGIALVWKGPMC